MAFMGKRTRGGRTRWCIYWTDRTRGAGKAGRREVDCEAGDHAEALDAPGLPGGERAALALGATNRAQRRKLLECYEVLERAKAREAARIGGRRMRYDTPIADLVDAYEAVLAYRVDRSVGLPEHAECWRPTFIERPLSAHGLSDQRTTLRRFRDSTVGLPTGDLTAEVLGRFLGSVLARGNKPRSYNKARAYLRAMLFGLSRDAALSLFRVDIGELFREDVEALPESRGEIVVHATPEIVAFLEAADAAAEPGRVLEIERLKGGRVERFCQAPSSPAAPVLEAALLLLATGVRRGEALALRWRDVDLVRGILTVRASKTSTVRYVPLAGDVAPRFLELLRAWREADPERDTILPANGANGPAWPKVAWERLVRETGIAQFGPQGCRRTFESALACVGVPHTLSAFWLGHSPTVAYKHYLAFAPGRLPGRTVEEILGLVPYLERAIERSKTRKAFRIRLPGNPLTGSAMVA